MIVHIGTRPIKNPQISIKVVEELRRRGYNVELAIVGSYSKEVEEVSMDKDFVRVLFNADERTKLEVLCSAKALILPSSGEAFPFTTLEAMACGTPPIVSGAVPEEVLINGGVNGIRVNSLNPIDYANALERLLNNEELWISISRNSREFIKNFDHIKIASNYLDIITRIIEK